MWVDMNSAFRCEPIVIKGAMRFGLKEIAKTMYRHKMIKTVWADDSPQSGLSAMIGAIKHYQLIDECRTGKTPTAKRRKLAIMKSKFQKIIRYNEVDCKVVWDIVKYLRENHTGPDDEEDDE